MERIVAGLIKGRHDPPVEEYIFDSVENVFDFDGIRRQVADFLKRKVGVEVGTGLGLNGTAIMTLPYSKGKRPLPST